MTQATLTRKRIVEAKPFLKWAGGKRGLLKDLEKRYPEELRDGKITKYCEPFIGGGAVFFNIMRNYDIEKSMIIDINQELILVYRTIKKAVEELISKLKKIEEEYLSLEVEGQKDFFHDVRKEFNENLDEIDFDNRTDAWIERTAQTIFLNRTCFNGLFRVNSKGEFNVPYGKHNNPQICNADNLRNVSKVIQNTEIKRGEYSLADEFIDSETFVYFDPPYRPLNRTSSFTSYSKFEFTDEEQLELARFFRKMDKKGAKLLLSNSDPKNEDPNDDFFEKAYEGYEFDRVLAARSINSKGDKRNKINEILISN